ncbi:hypothetical protein Cni_G06326 [Canna indica]|uniref:SWIM-type domain-containing protein n=1 Tax=Canna indica TaxID=4628 RepID=A0AAQ3JYB4_9LILI|nr:hypothetical protein Cni_G06326 [Canna indica]
MSELQTTSDRAHQDFLTVGVTKFCQTYISVGCKSDAVSNNLSETFNDIRRMLMARMYEKRELMLKNNDTICPSIRKKLEENKEETRYCHVTPVGNMKFKVQELDKSSVVNLMNMTCSCQKWDLCGIPCNHAISCINWLKDDPDKYVNDYYKRDTYLKTYDIMLQPLTEKDTWPEVDGPHVLPPPVKKMPGRPKKKRRRDMHEDETGTRLSRGGLVITCQICFQDGHNRRSCPLRGHPSSTQSQGGDNEPRMSNQPGSRRPSMGGSTSRSGRSSSHRGVGRLLSTGGLQSVVYHRRRPSLYVDNDLVGTGQREGSDLDDCMVKRLAITTLIKCYAELAPPTDTLRSSWDPTAGANTKMAVARRRRK